MISFQWPWLFLLLPLPLLWRLLLPSSTQQEAALRVPDTTPFDLGSGGTNQPVNGNRGLLWLATIAWLALVCATARPQWLDDALELPVSGRDLMLAVDLSVSMQTEDFVQNGEQMNRLQATQRIAGEFIRRRVGDRVGLILFGRQAYVQTPLTFDRTTVNQLLQEAAIGLAGKETAIGDAIGLAVKRLSDNPDGSKILVLLTDGANTAGEVEPPKAAELAASKGLTIYTIGIGADRMLVRSLFGNREVNPSRDLDEKSLSAIAGATGGRYFRARNSEELEKIYAIIDQLEPVEQDKQSFRPHQPLFFWPLGLALLLVALIITIKLRRGW